jgi:O-antigen/teichoic acid export membrane protein
MMIASVAGGAFMWSVHLVMQKPVEQIPLGPITEFLKRFIGPPVSESQYGLFATLLNLVMWMSIPSNGLQTVFAQQTAGATDEDHERQLRGTVRSVLSATTLIWALLTVLFFVLRDRILSGLNVPDPGALWLTVIVGLPILWTPIFAGLMQGRQNFLWLGWTSMMSGFGRCIAALIIVRMLGWGVTGAMAAVLIGSAVPLLFSLWQTYGDWHGPRVAVQWGQWLRRLIPLTTGLGVTVVMLIADMIIVRHFFPPTETGFYAAASTLGRALFLFTVPLAGVMFPKIVRSAALAERTDVLAQALGATAVMGAGAALFLTIFPKLPLQIVYAPSYLVVAPLVPWYLWCVLPLTLANILINNLLARRRFQIVPWITLIALAYVATLWMVARNLSQSPALQSFRTIVQLLGAFSVLLLLTSIWFTWRKK